MMRWEVVVTLGNHKGETGADNRARTYYLRITNALLCPVSYVGAVFIFLMFWYY